MLAFWVRAVASALSVGGAVFLFLQSLFSSRRRLLVCFFQDNPGYPLEFRADAQHSMCAAVAFVRYESREKSDDEVHELEVGSRASILRILEDIGE